MFFLLTCVSLSLSLKKPCSVLLTGNVTYGQDQDCILTVPLTVWPFLAKWLNISDAHLQNGNSYIIGSMTPLWEWNEIMHRKHLAQCLALGWFPNAGLSSNLKWILSPTLNVLLRASIKLCFSEITFIWKHVSLTYWMLLYCYKKMKIIKKILLS